MEIQTNKNVHRKKLIQISSQIRKVEKQLGRVKLCNLEAIIRPSRSRQYISTTLVTDLCLRI